MRPSWLIGLSLSLLSFGACAAESSEDLDDQDWLDGKGDGQSGQSVAATHLDVDLDGNRVVATIELEKNGNVALEVGDLTIESVTDDDGRNRKFRVLDGKLLVSRVR